MTLNILVLSIIILCGYGILYFLTHANFFAKFGDENVKIYKKSNFSSLGLRMQLPGPTVQLTKADTIYLATCSAITTVGMQTS